MSNNVYMRQHLQEYISKALYENRGISAFLKSTLSLFWKSVTMLCAIPGRKLTTHLFLLELVPHIPHLFLLALIKHLTSKTLRMLFWLQGQRHGHLWKRLFQLGTGSEVRYSPSCFLIVQAKTFLRMRNIDSWCILARCLSANQPPRTMYNDKEEFCSPFALQWNERMFCLQLRTVWPVTSCISLSVFKQKSCMYWTYIFCPSKHVYISQDFDR